MDTTPIVYLLQVNKKNKVATPIFLLVKESFIFTSEYEPQKNKFYKMIEYYHIQNNVKETPTAYLKGFYDPKMNLTSITNGYFFIDPDELRGNMIGTFLLNRMVLWAKEHKGSMLDKIELLNNQAEDDNKDRRNRLYEQFGITFNYNEDDCLSGLSNDFSVDDLNTVDAWKDHIKIINIDVSKEIVVEGF